MAKPIIYSNSFQVKVEVNFVMCGTVQPVRRASPTPTARDVLMADLDILVVLLEDVYGGKLVAALDRQHLRDLFDVMQLFAHESITPSIRRAFVVYRPAATGLSMRCYSHRCGTSGTTMRTASRV